MNTILNTVTGFFYFLRNVVWPTASTERAIRLIAEAQDELNEVCVNETSLIANTNRRVSDLYRVMEDAERRNRRSQQLLDRIAGLGQ